MIHKIKSNCAAFINKWLTFIMIFELCGQNINIIQLYVLNMYLYRLSYNTTDFKINM